MHTSVRQNPVVTAWENNLGCQGAFGMVMPDREWNSGTGVNGMNGMRRDDEITACGCADSYNAQHWQYDPRTGRRWNIDPIDAPSVSDYASYSNNPIANIDPEGNKPEGCCGDLWNTAKEITGDVKDGAVNAANKTWGSVSAAFQSLSNPGAAIQGYYETAWTNLTTGNIDGFLAQTNPTYAALRTQATFMIGGAQSIQSGDITPVANAYGEHLFNGAVAIAGEGAGTAVGNALSGGTKATTAIGTVDDVIEQVDNVAQKVDDAGRTSANETAQTLDDAAGGNLGNPFKNSTLGQIDDAFQTHVKSGKLELKFINPKSGAKSYLNTKSGYSYNLDPGGFYGKKFELPHIDINYPKPKPTFFDKKKLPVSGGF